jgi:hypothetical protein
MNERIFNESIRDNFSREKSSHLRKVDGMESDTEMSRGESSVWVNVEDETTRIIDKRIEVC